MTSDYARVCGTCGHRRRTGGRSGIVCSRKWTARALSHRRFWRRALVATTTRRGGVLTARIRRRPRSVARVSTVGGGHSLSMCRIAALAAVGHLFRDVSINVVLLLAWKTAKRRTSTATLYISNMVRSGSGRGGSYGYGCC